MPWRHLVSAGQLDCDRVLSSTDAIFAIAITLLVVDIRFPVAGNINFWRELHHTVPQMVG